MKMHQRLVAEGGGNPLCQLSLRMRGLRRFSPPSDLAKAMLVIFATSAFLNSLLLPGACVLSGRSIERSLEVGAGAYSIETGSNSPQSLIWEASVFGKSLAAGKSFHRDSEAVCAGGLCVQPPHTLSVGSLPVSISPPSSMLSMSNYSRLGRFKSGASYSASPTHPLSLGCLHRSFPHQLLLDEASSIDTSSSPLKGGCAASEGCLSSSHTKGLPYLPQPSKRADKAAFPCRATPLLSFTHTTHPTPIIPTIYDTHLTPTNSTTYHAHSTPTTHHTHTLKPHKLMTDRRLSPSHFQACNSYRIIAAFTENLAPHLSPFSATLPFNTPAGGGRREFLPSKQRMHTFSYFQTSFSSDSLLPQREGTCPQTLLSTSIGLHPSSSCQHPPALSQGSLKILPSQILQNRTQLASSFQAHPPVTVEDEDVKLLKRRFLNGEIPTPEEAEKILGLTGWESGAHTQGVGGGTFASSQGRKGGGGVSKMSSTHSQPVILPLKTFEVLLYTNLEAAKQLLQLGRDRLQHTMQLCNRRHALALASYAENSFKKVALKVALKRREEEADEDEEAASNQKNLSSAYPSWIFYNDCMKMITLFFDDLRGYLQSTPPHMSSISSSPQQRIASYPKFELPAKPPKHEEQIKQFKMYVHNLWRYFNEKFFDNLLPDLSNLQFDFTKKLLYDETGRHKLSLLIQEEEGEGGVGGGDGGADSDSGDACSPSSSQASTPPATPSSSPSSAASSTPSSLYFSLPRILLSERLMMRSSLLGYELLNIMLDFYELTSPHTHLLSLAKFEEEKAMAAASDDDIFFGGKWSSWRMRNSFTYAEKRAELLRHIEGMSGISEGFPFIFFEGFLGDLELGQNLKKRYGSYLQAVVFSDTLDALILSNSVDSVESAVSHYADLIERRSVDELWAYGRLPVREYAASLFSNGIEMASKILEMGFNRLSALRTEQLNFVQNCFIHVTYLYLSEAMKSKPQEPSEQFTEGMAGGYQPKSMKRANPEELAAQSLYLLQEIFNELKGTAGKLTFASAIDKATGQGEGSKKLPPPLSKEEEGGAGSISHTQAPFKDKASPRVCAEGGNDYRETTGEAPYPLSEDEKLMLPQHREKTAQYLIKFFNYYCFDGKLPVQIDVQFAPDLHTLVHFSWSFDSLQMPTIYVNTKLKDATLFGRLLLEELLCVWEIYSKRDSDVTKGAKALNESQIFNIERMMKKKREIRRMCEQNSWPFHFDEVETLHTFQNEDEKMKMRKTVDSLMGRKGKDSEVMNVYFTMLNSGISPSRAVELQKQTFQREVDVVQNVWEKGKLPMRPFISALLAHKRDKASSLIASGWKELIGLDDKMLTFAEASFKVACSIAWIYQHQEGGENVGDLKQNYLENIGMVEFEFKRLRDGKKLQKLLIEEEIDDKALRFEEEEDEVGKESKKKQKRVKKNFEIETTYTKKLVKLLDNGSALPESQTEKLNEASNMFDAFNLAFFDEALPKMKISFSDEDEGEASAPLMLELSEVDVDYNTLRCPSIKINSQAVCTYRLLAYVLLVEMSKMFEIFEPRRIEEEMPVYMGERFTPQYKIDRLGWVKEAIASASPQNEESNGVCAGIDAHEEGVSLESYLVGASSSNHPEAASSHPPPQPTSSHPPPQPTSSHPPQPPCSPPPSYTAELKMLKEMLAVREEKFGVEDIPPSTIEDYEEVAKALRSSPSGLKKISSWLSTGSFEDDKKASESEELSGGSAMQDGGISPAHTTMRKAGENGGVPSEASRISKETDRGEKSSTPSPLPPVSEFLRVSDEDFSPQVLQERHFAAVQDHLDSVLSMKKWPISLAAKNSQWQAEMTELETQLLVKHTALSDSQEVSSLYRTLVTSEACSPRRAAYIVEKSIESMPLSEDETKASGGGNYSH